jgi:hypothetical protein
MSPTATITDARGRKVRLLPLVGARELGEAWTDGRAALIQDAWMSSIAFKKEVAIQVAILIGTALPVGVLLGKKAIPEWSHGAFLGVAAIFMVLSFWNLRRRAAPRFAQNLVRRGLCASCGYPLRSITPEPDGIRTCPECGSAWKMEERA